MFPTIKIQEKLFTRYHYGLIKAHLDDEDDDDEMIKTIKDIEKRMVKLHKEIIDIKSTPRGN